MRSKENDGEKIKKVKINGENVEEMNKMRSFPQSRKLKKSRKTEKVIKNRRKWKKN